MHSFIESGDNLDFFGVSLGKDMDFLVPDVGILRYSALPTHLTLFEGIINGRILKIKNRDGYIFRSLDIDAIQLAKKAYGYTPMGGDFPRYKSGDYAAAHRLARMLYQILEGERDVYSEFFIAQDRINSRFEILDL